MKTLAIRLEPDQDLKLCLEQFVSENSVLAACMLTCVGSLKNAVLRLANSDSILKRDGPFEIVSLVGTFSENGCHLHCSLSDENGNMIGGHLLPGNNIFTTAEVVIVEVENFQFIREFDKQTGFDELVVTRKCKLNF